MRNAIRYYILLLALVTAFVACDKDKDGAPSITRLRAIAPAPNDSTLTLAGPGQTVVIQGNGFASTTQVYFNGYPAPFNSALLADNNIVVTIPADMPFASLNQDDLNKVKVVTANGEVVFNFPIVPPAPVISAMSNENAVAGTRVTIYGNNFFFIDKVIFPGGKEATTNITSNNTGTQLEVTVPAGITTGGTIKVANRYGAGTSVLLFNDFTTGVLHNGDNVDKMEWGGEAVTDNSAYPGGHGNFARIKGTAIAGGDGGWWNGNKSINTHPGEWVPVADLNKPLDNYAVKFEINVKVPWSSGHIYIVRDGDWTYLANWAPWKKADGSVAPFTTNGWQTVEIPLTQFRTKANGVDGSGDPASSLSTFLKNGTSWKMNIMFVNLESTTIENLELNLDNIRVVKVK